MRLLIITQVVDRNHDLLGAFHQWIIRFSEVFDSVEVICLFEGEHSLPRNVTVHSLGKELRPSRLWYLWNFYRYIFLLRKKYDAVFVHMNPEYVVLAGIFWRLMNKKIFLWFAHKNGGIMRKLALPLVHRVVSVSKESFANHDSSKFLAVGHGIDTSVLTYESMALQPEKKSILSIGRLSPVKEYDRLLDAAHLLQEKYERDDFVIRLIGSPANTEDTTYVDNLKKKAIELKLDVRFEGSMPNKDIAPLIRASSVFVSMQCQGGAGKSFLEAMAVGVPTIVCTPVFNEVLGTWKEYVFYNGSTEEFAKCLNAMLELDSEKRKALGLHLRSIVQEGYELKTLVRKIRDAYIEVRL